MKADDVFGGFVTVTLSLVGALLLATGCGLGFVLRPVVLAWLGL